MTDREKELIAKGLAAEERERGELFDNCYRAGLFRDGSYGKGVSTEDMRRTYNERLAVLYPGTF